MEKVLVDVELIERIKRKLEDLITHTNFEALTTLQLELASTLSSPQEVKSKEDIKQKIAEQYGYKDFAGVLKNYWAADRYVNESMEEYAAQFGGGYTKEDVRKIVADFAFHWNTEAMGFDTIEEALAQIEMRHINFDAAK
jgi:hypothetical protein